MSGKKVLVVDPDVARRSLHVFGLRCAGLGAEEAADSAAARSRIADSYPHMVLIVAAALDGGVRDFVRALREDPYTRDLQVLALVEHASAPDARSALEWGIDDLLAAPIAPEEFVARVRAGLACNSQGAPAAAAAAGLTLDCEHGVARKESRSVTLGPTERRLLELFLARPEQLIPRDLLLFRIWGGASPHSRVVDVSVCRLRRALEQIGCDGLLQTVSGHGYRLSTCTADSAAHAPIGPGRNHDVTFGSSNARRA